MTATTGILSTLSDELAGAVERGSAAVVGVDARQRLGASGVVWPGGFVVTADHVLERDDNITVALADGTKVAATIAGRDPGSDLAILKLESGAPAPASLAPADSVRVGHFVLALGRPSGEAAMASFGVVSSLSTAAWRTGRGGMVEGYIRADVSLLPGFSGGPLVDTQGRIIGLNSYYLAQGQEIAVPAAAVSAIVASLQADGRIRRAYLGVTSQPVRLSAAIQQVLGTEQATGLMLIGVETDSPAEKSGLLIGDILVAVAGSRVGDPEDLRVALGAVSVGQATPVTVVRGGQRQELTVTPGERS